jgi:hypothetical protein
MPDVTINGKVYDLDKLSPKAKNYILAIQETQNKRVRSTIELERCDVLLKYYDEKIKEELKNCNK